MDDQEASATQDPASSDGSTAAQSYTIEITVSPDGITVGVESADDDSAEAPDDSSASAAPADPSQPAAAAAASPASDSDSDSDAMPAKDIKEAMVMALMIYKNNGEMPQSDATGDDDFAQGYKSR